MMKLGMVIAALHGFFEFLSPETSRKQMLDHPLPAAFNDQDTDYQSVFKILYCMDLKHK